MLNLELVSYRSSQCGTMDENVVYSYVQDSSESNEILSAENAVQVVEQDQVSELLNTF